MIQRESLPPGQFELDRFPRFGLPQFANRFPQQTTQMYLKVVGDLQQPITVSDELKNLPRVEQLSDFHCVTTWSRRSLLWSGFRFSDFYEWFVIPRAKPQPITPYVYFRSQDGYGTSLPLMDLMAENVLLADRLNGEPLSLEHGAPLRLVAPSHYGFKNVKHLRTVEFWCQDQHYRAASPLRFMSHPRGRVKLEERGTGVPGRLLRYLYYPLIYPTIWFFQYALKKHRGNKSGDHK